MSLLHVRHIKSRLTQLYDELIDLNDVNENERELSFLSRALAAFALSIYSDISPEDAAKCITDGYKDNGIDAIYYDRNFKALYIVQSKWIQSGNGSITLDAGMKLTKGVEDIINENFGRFNDKVQQKAKEIYIALEDPNTKIYLVLAYTGQQDLSEPVQEHFDTFFKRVNDVDESFHLKVLSQSSLHLVVTKNRDSSPIDIEIPISNWGQIKEPFQAFYGQVSALDIADWWEAYNYRLFTPNIRQFLGDTDINKSLQESLKQEPEKFWYYNNGITVLCSSIQKKHIGSTSRDSGTFVCKDVSIVNGAQTVGCIGSIKTTNPHQLANSSILVRLISLENCPDNFADEVTKATNTQNKIELKDFVSLDPEQERLYRELAFLGVHYEYKSGDYSNNSPSFDLSEATTVLACSHPNIEHSVAVKQKISLLWKDITKPPYKSLFKPSLTGNELWNLIQIQKVVDETIEAAIGNIKPSKYNRDRQVLVHGNRFIAYQLFKRIALTQIENEDFVSDILKVEVEEKVKNIITALLNVFSTHEYESVFLYSFFKSSANCRQLETHFAGSESNTQLSLLG